MIRVTGWDIGGANVKAAHVLRDEHSTVVKTVGRVFEIWKDPAALVNVLRAVADELPEADATAVTMTAELSDVFRTKREGVSAILDTIHAVAQGRLAVFTTDGVFVDETEARARPLTAAASNWLATALLVARHVPDALLVDIGTTTTDVIPIQGGRVAAIGRTDPERLLTGELVYTGAVRTTVAAIVHSVPLWSGECPVAAEYFAVSGDAHLLLGDLAPAEYTGSTPDGRPASAACAAERLARVVCADVEMLTAGEILAIARAVADAQVRQIAAAIRRVAARSRAPVEVITTGLGAFLAHRAAAVAGCASRDLNNVLHVDVGWAAPAAAIAWLLADTLSPAAS
jgi:(4-(4-[2-(gamma-L-glutamylamino)ethyl]phenoxymethyl)furan-2-yl)methanamine synthase